MSEVLSNIRKFMEKEGIPGRDSHDLPTSEKCFPDGANYRIEIAGVERASTMRTMIDEAQKRRVPIHRAIVAVGGSTYCEFEELQYMARIAKKAKIETVMTVGHRKGWDAEAKELSNTEGCMQGWRLRGSDHISYHIADIMRSVEAGFRGFLVYDEGVLYILNKMRAEGILPEDTFFKFSVFGGYCSAAGAKVIETMGANSMNPSSDVSLAILGGIRKTIEIPLDVYIIIPDSFGGQFRAYEGPEIARVASPCYFKFEPGTSEGDIYKPWVTEEFHANLIREKVKIAKIVTEIMEQHAPGLELSPQGPDDLTLSVCE